MGWWWFVPPSLTSVPTKAVVEATRKRQIVRSAISLLPSTYSLKQSTSKRKSCLHKFVLLHSIEQHMNEAGNSWAATLVSAFSSRSTAWGNLNSAWLALIWFVVLVAFCWIVTDPALPGQGPLYRVNTSSSQAKLTIQNGLWLRQTAEAENG